MIAIDAVLKLIREERSRQVGKGYTSAHDDDHSDGEIAVAAYALLSVHLQEPGVADDVPPGADWIAELTKKLRSADPRRRLIVASALLVAEIERLDRLAVATGKGV